MNEYFISDPHFGHRLMAKLRGFSSTNEHDRFLYRAWLESLPENQQLKLWILGDNHCGDVAAETAALELLSQFRLELLERKGSLVEFHGLLGNHDLAHPKFPNGYERLKYFYRVYDSMQTTSSMVIGNQQVMLNHFPYEGNEYDNPWMDQYRLRDLGLPLLHGHTHSRELISYTHKGTLQLCVNVEACPGFVPLSRQEVEILLKKFARPLRR